MERKEKSLPFSGEEVEEDRADQGKSACKVKSAVPEPNNVAKRQGQTGNMSKKRLGQFSLSLLVNLKKKYLSG